MEDAFASESRCLCFRLFDYIFTATTETSTFEYSVTAMKTFLSFLFAAISFVSYSQPFIVYLSPKAGPVGSSVTINGANFSTTPSANIVFFGGVRATVTAATASTLTVMVPFGSMHEPVSVTTNGLTAYSSLPFVTTYSGTPGLSSSSFASKVNFGTGYWSDKVMLADVDEDGKADMINIHSTGKLSIHRNTSSINSVSFASQQDFTTSNYPQDLAVSDVDGDGKLDIVVICPDFVNIFKNTTTNSIVSFTRTDMVGTADAGSVVVTDFNQDGKPDIATVGSNSNFISVYKNITTGGNISFGSAQSFSTAGSAFSFTAGDFDGDRKADLAIAGYNSSTLTVLLNTSTPSAISFSSAIIQTNQQGIRHIAIADFTGDGRNDMAIANIGSSKIHLYQNISTTGSISFAPKVDLTVAQEPKHIAAADMNGDGKPDVVSANVNASSVSVYVNTTTSAAMSFAPGVAFAGIDSESPYAVAIADLTADGKPDIVASNYQSAQLSVLRSRVNEPSNCSGNLAVQVSVTDEPCGNNGLGKATFTTTGGNGSIQYSLDGLNYQNGNTVHLPVGQYQVITKDDGGCTASASFTIKKEPSPLAIALSDTIVPCGSASLSLSVGVTNGVKPYQYRLNNGTYSTINSFSNLVPGKYLLSVKDSVNCTKEMQFTILQGGPPRLNISSPFALCSGATLDLTAPAIAAGSDPGLSYTYWSDTAALQQLANPSAVTAAGTYYIKATAPGGCFTIKPAVVSIVEQPKTPVITTESSVQVCQGDSVILRSSAAANYQWFRNNTIITGATAQTYTVTQPGDYEVHIANACFTAASNTIAVSITPTPSITATGPTTFCSGSSVVLTSSSPSGNQWFRNDIAITDSTSQTLTVKEGGNYTVRVTTASCTSSASNILAVTLKPTPAAPHISQSGNSLQSSVPNGNQWYKEGIIISGATGQTYTATAVGVYTANVTNSGCTSPFSNTIALATLSTSNALDSNVKSGPNPTQNFLEIKYTGASPSYIVNVLDLQGNVLIRLEVFVKNYLLDMRDLVPGYYVVQIITPDNGDRLQRMILKQ